ncbi:hypothetical protein JL721_4276 [Aureococcus anophagefferens]|nr:hypothetical protein JL721_4276 [Aureococcus anophagefferens]
MLGRFALRCRAAASPARRFASSEQRATLLATQDEVNTRLAARRVMRLMASFARQRTLRPLTRTLRDFADRSSRFRASTLHGAVEHRLSWAFGARRRRRLPAPRGFDADDALLERVATAPWAELPRDAARPPGVRPRCPRRRRQELSALTLGFAACLPPRRTAEASPMRARRKRSKRRRDAAAADGGGSRRGFPSDAGAAPRRRGRRRRVRRAAVAAAAGPPAAAAAAVERAAGELGCGVAAVLGPSRTQSRSLRFRGRRPPSRQKLEAALARERGGAAQPAAPGCGRSRSAGGAFDFDFGPGDEAPAAPARDDDDDASWVGRKNRRAADMPGSIVQLAVAEARGAASRPTTRTRGSRCGGPCSWTTCRRTRRSASSRACSRARGPSRVELFGAAPEDADSGDGERRRKKKPGERAPYRLRLSVAHRSPTCALVTFDAQSGADAALDQALRVFGVVVRKRACRTRPASDVRSIYIHRLPPNVSERELLDDLGECLAPDLQLRLWRTDPLDPPDRARLRFKSHDLARLAWRRLEDESPFADNLSWTPTAPLRGAKAASR